jgi:hypothetical protein
MEIELVSSDSRRQILIQGLEVLDLRGVADQQVGREIVTDEAGRRYRLVVRIRGPLDRGMLWGRIQVRFDHPQQPVLDLGFNGFVQ